MPSSSSSNNNHHHDTTNNNFRSTVSLHKLRRFNILILLLRFASFCFSFASSIFMLTNSPHCFHYDAFRFLMAATSIVAVYSLFEIAASVYDISRGTTLFPETLQVWFDFGHDQVFAYLVLSSTAAGTELARRLRDTGMCETANAFCVQSDISIALGLVGFVFLGFSSLLSGFRVACFLIHGSRFHI